MPQRAKIRKFGGSLGFILPKEIAESMMVREGDELYLTATSEGMTATPFDPDFDETLEDARSFMRTHRNAFKKLAE